MALWSKSAFARQSSANDGVETQISAPLSLSAANGAAMLSCVSAASEYNVPPPPRAPASSNTDRSNEKGA